MYILHLPTNLLTRAVSYAAMRETRRVFPATAEGKEPRWTQTEGRMTEPRSGATRSGSGFDTCFGVADSPSARRVAGHRAQPTRPYLQQYLDRGPRRRWWPQATRDSRDPRRTSSDCDPADNCDNTTPFRKSQAQRSAGDPGRGWGLPGAPVAAIPEITVEVSAGAGTAAEEFVSEVAHWHWPENVLRHEGGAAPENLRILKVRGNSMEPEMREGDRVVVDISRRLPATGEKFVLWDGNGLVVKRIETVHGDTVNEDKPPRIRLISVNPDYAPYSCLVQEVHLVGKVLWKVARA